jgi:hypothetical protein
MEARTLHMPRLPVVIIPHPLGGLTPGEVEERAIGALQKIITLLDQEKG